MPGGGALRCVRGDLSHVLVPDDAALDIAGAFSVSCSVRFERFPTDAGAGITFIAKGQNGVATDNFWLGGRTNVGGTAWSFRTRFGDGVDMWGAPLLSYTIEAGRWYALLVTYDVATGVHTLYAGPREYPGGPIASAFDDDSTSTHAGPPTPNANAEDLYIGCASDGAGGLESGSDVSICEVAIYDTALSQATAEARLTTRLVGDEANLVGYWPLDEGTGSTAYDRSGNGNDGTLTRSPWWTTGPTDIYYGHGILDVGHGFLGWHTGASRPLSSVACSDEQSTHPAANLQNPLQVYTSRTAAAGPGAKAWVWSFDKPLPIWAVIIIHNFTSAAGGGAITLELHDEDLWVAPFVDEVVRYHPGILAHVFDSPGQYQYMRLVVTDAANPDGYLEVGLLSPFVIYPIPQPMRVARPMRDPSTAVELQHRHRVPRNKTVGRDLEVTIEDLRRGQSLYLRQILEEVGGGAAVWLVPDASRDLYTGAYGIISGLPTETSDPSKSLVTVSGLRVREDHG